jgi:hypothetical protein
MATAVADGKVRRGWPLRLPERLPDLRGKWLTIYSVLWAAALLVAVVAPIRSTVLNYRGLGHPVWRPHGIVTRDSDHGIIVTGVFGDEARRAGVHVGDTIIAVDGWAVRGRSADYRLYKMLDGPEGSTVRLTLQSPSRPDRDVTLASHGSTMAQMFRGTGVSRPIFDAAIHFLDVAFLLFLVPAAVVLFASRRREIIPALLSISFLVITGFVSGRLALLDAGLSGRVDEMIGVVFGWFPLVLALATFPDGRLVPKWAIAAPLLIVISIVNDVSQHIEWLDNLIAGLAFAVAGIALVVRYRRYPRDLGRQQLRWALFGFLLGISLLMVVVLGLTAGDQLTAGDARWAVWMPMLLNLCAGLSFACMALGLMVSVLRYRLYDADTVIGRSAAYGVLTLGFVALFAGAEKLAELIGERYFEHSIGIVAGAVGAAVAAAVIVPLHNRVHRWAERRFQKPLIRLREGLPECVADLRESAPVEQLVAAVMSRLEAGVRSTREAVLLADKGKFVVAGTRGVSAKELREWQRRWTRSAAEGTLDCVRADPLFPLRVRLDVESGDAPQTIGWLMLGPRPDGSFFGKDEREAIEHVAGPVARAIHIAQLREQRDEKAEKRIGALETLIATLVEAIGAVPVKGTARA